MRRSQSGFQRFFPLWAQSCFRVFIFATVAGHSLNGGAQSTASETLVTNLNRFPVIAEWRFSEDTPAHQVGSGFWLSDDEILTASQPRPAPPREPGLTIMHWKLSTNQKSKHMPGSVVCADALTRYVQISVEPSYIASLSKGYASLEGVWNAQGVGMNAYVRYPELEDLSKSMYINTFTCRRYMGHKNDRISGAAVFLLREEHGMLHHPLNALTSRHGYPQRLFFRQAKSEQDLTIEFKEPEYYNTFTVYYPFEQKYLLRGSMTIPNDTQPKTPIPMRLMSTTGKIEIIQPPAAMWAYARTHQLVPQLSKKGLLWYMWTNNPEDSLMGTYVQEGGTLLRFTRGRMVVSPSGCRASEHDGRAEWIKVYELCKE